MAEIIATFADGRLLVYEDRYCGEISVVSGALYVASGTQGVGLRVGFLRQVEKVLSIDNSWANVGVITPLSEVIAKDDKIYVPMRRGDMGLVSGWTSGFTQTVSGSLCITSAIGNLFSGLPWLAEAVSGARISGIKIFATVVGY